jgi:hypothetical protein
VQNFATVPRWVWAIAWTVVGLAAVGLVFLLYWLLLVVGAAIARTNIIGGVGNSVHWMISNPNGPSVAIFWATVLLAVVTFVLFLATAAMGRAANIQARLAGPYLNVILVTDSMMAQHTQLKQWFQNLFVEPYGFAAEDSKDTNLAPLIANQQPAYVYFAVLNKQMAAHGVAAEVRITVTLFFGASSGSAPNHPFSITRQIQLNAVEPNAVLAGSIFNVANLGGYMVQATQVEYRDVAWKRRGAASGVGIINVTPAGTQITYRIFKPRRREYTGGIGRR